MNRALTASLRLSPGYVAVHVTRFRFVSNLEERNTLRCSFRVYSVFDHDETIGTLTTRVDGMTFMARPGVAAVSCPTQAEIDAFADALVSLAQARRAARQTAQAAEVTR